ncbi:chromosome-associated kinesin KIF4-like [Ixodes scapularis]
MLQAKEDLAQRLHAVEEHLEVVHSLYQGKIQELEREVELLMKEKDDLSALVANGNNANKKTRETRTLEQRRKRIKELEERVAKLRKKVQEQATVLGLKEEEPDVKKLREEILEMKKTRVRLMRQLKEESEQHRRAQREHDREVSTLRLREQQRVAQAARQERQSGLMMSALQRRMENALADKSRLEAALQKQQVAAGQMDTTGEMAHRIRGTVEQEIALPVRERSEQLQTQLQPHNANTRPLRELQSKLLEPKASSGRLKQVEGSNVRHNVAAATKRLEALQKRLDSARSCRERLELLQTQKGERAAAATARMFEGQPPYRAQLPDGTVLHLPGDDLRQASRVRLLTEQEVEDTLALSLQDVLEVKEK